TAPNFRNCANTLNSKQRKTRNKPESAALTRLSIAGPHAFGAAQPGVQIHIVPATSLAPLLPQSPVSSNSYASVSTGCAKSCHLVLLTYVCSLLRPPAP